MPPNARKMKQSHPARWGGGGGGGSAVKSICSSQIREDFVPKIKELTKNKWRDVKEVVYLFIRGED